LLTLITNNFFSVSPLFVKHTEIPDNDWKTGDTEKTIYQTYNVVVWKGISLSNTAVDDIITDASRN